ncbi:MAG: mechanosensitive ion channel [Spirochaetaceae bacterium]|jgi:small-conductance mechanosensitive channel|nr:mechanosensitive ion channel [Spirochaetaceae bacterium]
MDQEQIYYFSSIVAVSAILLVSIQILFRRALKKRKAIIDRIRESESIDTSTPLDRPLRYFKTRAKAGVTNRFSIFRKVAIIIAFLTLAIAFSFPFIDRLPQAFISILVGSAAIITGMAAKPFIENFLSGIAITSSKMLNIGDTILINDQYGTIEDISSTHTVIKLWDWRRFVIPNSTMINKEFVNFTLNDKWQWAHVEFYISYDSDLELVKSIAQDSARSCNKMMGIEDPSFWIMETNKDSIKCWIAAWAASPIDAWEMKAEIRTSLILGLNKAGIKSHTNYHTMKN